MNFAYLNQRLGDVNKLSPRALAEFLRFCCREIIFESTAHRTKMCLKFVYLDSAAKHPKFYNTKIQFLALGIMDRDY